MCVIDPYFLIVLWSIPPARLILTTSGVNNLKCLFYNIFVFFPLTIQDVVSHVFILKSSSRDNMKMFILTMIDTENFYVMISIRVHW